MMMGKALQTMDRRDLDSKFMGVTAGLSSWHGFELLQRMATMFNHSSLVPQQFQGDANFGNCVIALNMAQRMNADPLMVMQNLYVVYGIPGWSSKFLIATFNQCGRYSSIHYKETGKKGTDSWGCIAWAKEVSTGEVIEGPEVTIQIAKDEGWYQKKGSKWPTMPGQMLRYRAASWFIRTTAPELSMGLQTVEEIEDTGEINVTPPMEEIARNANSEVFDPGMEGEAREAKPEVPVQSEKKQGSPHRPVATRDMYMYHPATGKYFVIRSGEEFPDECLGQGACNEMNQQQWEKAKERAEKEASPKQPPAPQGPDF